MIESSGHGLTNAKSGKGLMEYLIGILLAVGVAVFAVLTGFVRDRSFPSVVLIVNGTYYILFAVMGGSALLEESIVAMVFTVLAVAGYKWSPWLAAAGMVGHGIFDVVHSRLIHNPGVPVWWPGFCMSFDVVAGVAIAVLLLTRLPAASSQTMP